MENQNVIKREDLVSALGKAKFAVDSKETAAQSSCILFLEDHIVADNELLHISIPFQSGIAGAVKAEELIQVVNKSNNPIVTIEEKDSMLVLKYGRSRTGLQISQILRENISSFDPKLKSSGKISKKFLDSLNLCSSCCTDNLNSLALSGVHVEKNHMIGCDNFQSMFIKVDAPKIKGHDQLLIPAYAIPSIVAINSDSIAEFDDPDYENFFCAFNSESKEKVYFECIDLEVNPYPDIASLFEVENAEEFQFPDGAVEAISKAEIFAKNSLKNEEICVKIIVNNGTMKIYGEGANGFYEETFDHEGKDDFSFIVSPKTLSSVIGKKSSSIKISKEDNPRILFSMDDCIYMVTIDEVEE